MNVILKRCTTLKLRFFTQRALKAHTSGHYPRAEYMGNRTTAWTARAWLNL